MVRSKLPKFPWLAALFVLPGCGTVHNLQTEQAPFGGVAYSYQAGVQRLTDPIRPSCGPTILEPFVAAYILAVDVPLSIGGDLATLPAIVWLTMQSRASVSAEPPAPTQE